jgi:two-component system phosphate regulon sensor histidine kinase PhoR
MGLKKIFPVIVVLITLSLIGIIYIQINWILTMMQNKRTSCTASWYVAECVTQDLVEQRGIARPDPAAETRRSLAAHRSLYHGIDAGAPMYGTVYRGRCQRPIRKAFEQGRLKNAAFEFSVTSNLNSADFHTSGELFQSRISVQEFYKDDTADTQF